MSSIAFHRCVRFVAPLLLVAATGCSPAADEVSESTATSQSELGTCRTTTLVATKKYTAPASTTDATASVTGGMGVKIPASLSVTAGTTGTGSATFSFRRSGSSSDVACTYKALTTTTFGFKSCADGTASGSVVTATKLTIHILGGNTSDPAGKTVVTFAWVEASNCTVDAGTDAAADAAKDGDADAPNDGGVDAPRDAANAVTDAGSDAPKDGPVDAPKDAASNAPKDALSDATDAAACTPESCDDGNGCTTDTCNGSSCTHANALNNSPCGSMNRCFQAFSCQSGVCAGSSPVACSASDQCHGAGTCDPMVGCSNPAKADGASCTDGNACTQLDACQSGTCTGANPVVCTASDQCHDVGACNTSTGTCSNPAKSDGASCTDGNACTTVDTCQSGSCTGASPVSCAANDACHSAGTCSTATGVCSNPALVAGTACADNSNKCVGASTCNASAACVQAPTPVVDDGNACTQDSCDPGVGVAHATIPGCGPTTDRWAPVVGRPGPRDGAASAFDTTSNALILFGGENAGASLGDTWTLDGASGRWSVVYAGGPDARAAAAVAFDSVRKRIVLFGGIARNASGDTFLADTWEYDPAARTWAVRANASPPAARAYATALFDAARKRVVVFGGRGASGAADDGDLWEWDGATWARRAATGSPLARSAAASVYDSARNRYVLFGGESVLSPSIGVALDDTWELDPGTATWTSVTPSQRPPARLGHAMYFDAMRAKTVAFGGTSPAHLQLGDTWEYDGAAQTWNDRAPTASPAARAGHTLVYDATTSRGLLVGGVAYSTTGQHTPNLDDTWELDGASGAWTQRTADGAPALYRGGVVYDTARKTLVVRGDEARPAMWELAGGRWTSKDMLAGMSGDYGAAFVRWGANGGSTGEERRELARVGMVFDSTRGRTLYFASGTSSGGGSLGLAPSMWEWDGARWTSRTCAGSPLGLERASLAFDGARGRVVVTGGTLNGASVFGTWEVDPVTCAWTARTSVSSPPARTDAHAAWDSARSVVVMFGGSTPGGGAIQDTWEWDGAAGTWVQRSIGTAPDARALAGMAFDPGRQRVVLFGGLVGQVHGGTYLGDTWEYDGTTWTSKATSGPSARMSASLAFDTERSKIVLFGGAGTDGAPLGDVWDWDGAAWTQRALGAAPVARSGASGGWIPQRGLAVIFGGVRGDGERAYLQDTWIWKNGEWTTPSTARMDDTATQASGEQTPPPRAGHAFAVGAGALLFGGEGDGGLLADTWMWSDTTYAWTSMPSLNGPSARSGHAMAAFPQNGLAPAGFVLFGGTGANKTLLGDTRVWTQAAAWGGGYVIYGTTPSPRSMLAMATDPVRRKVVLFGGHGTTNALQDTWEYDIDGTSGWSLRVPSFSPPARFGHAMYYDTARDTVVMVGGSGDDPASTFGDAWEWDGAAGTWSILPSTASFEPRAGAVAFFDSARSQSVVFGGLAYRQAGAAVVTFGDTWAFTRANEKHRTGVACTDATGCASGFCADGYCCSLACSGQCGACDVAGSVGTCTAVSGAPHGSRSSCGGSGACGPRCDGSDLATCHPMAVGTVCSAASCSTDAWGMFPTATAVSTCDSQGNCAAAVQTPCNMFICGGNACLTSCTDSVQCVAGGFCNAADSTCRAYAQIASFVVSPVAGPVGTQFTMTLAARAGQNITYEFIYELFDLSGSSPAITCSRGPATSCSFTPTVAGNYDLTGNVTAAGSTRGTDDTRGIRITVTP